jgi:hypothetical protein
MSKIHVGDLLSVKYEARVTKHPGYPSINDGYFYVGKDDLLIAVADEFIHRHRMLAGEDILEPYVKVLTRDQHVYFANPRCLIRVTNQEAADKISE